MPFLHDTDPRDEARTPAWAAFATIGNQVERLVAVNVAWALQIAPGVLALSFPELPGWIRIMLGLYSATVLAPATAVLYAVAAHACRNQHVDVELVWRFARHLFIPGLRTLAPLYGTFGVLIWAMVAAGSTGLRTLHTPLTLILLLWSVCMTYWGPLTVANPDASARVVALAAVRLSWRYPGQALWSWALCAAAMVIGAVSIGGLVLIVPMFVAIVQTHRRIVVAAMDGGEPVRQ